jgi:molybdate transport system substrate-binding protein
LRRWTVAAAALVVGLAVTGCGDDGSGSSPTTTTVAPASGLSGDLTVSNAASLTAAFDQIGSEFVQAHPDVDLTFNPGSSATLATQIERGAPADVFASADEATMRRLVTAGVVDGPPEVFARNRLVIVTKRANPDRIETLADVANVDVVSLCAETAPCGRYAAEALRKAGVAIPETNVTRGTDSTATLAAVATGDADAGIVYVTDARTAGDRVVSVEIPAAQNVVALYPIAVLEGGANRQVARAFVDYVLSPRGQLALRIHGFARPT